jgi:hypothetical protein
VTTEITICYDLMLMMMMMMIMMVEMIMYVLMVIMVTATMICYNVNDDDGDCVVDCR